MGLDGKAAGLALTSLAALCGFVVSLVAYVDRGSGVDHTAGAFLVVMSTALLCGAAAALIVLRAMPPWLWRLLAGLCLLDIIGTSLAAAFLHSWLLLAAMAFAFAPWLARTAHFVRTGS